MGKSVFDAISYETAIADILRKGQNVRFSQGFVTFDDRLLQLKCARDFDSQKDVIVLGSSTCFQIRSKHFPNRSFYNHSLRRGVLEDIFSVYQIHRALKYQPKTLVIGVDGWIFDPTHWKSYWRVLYPQFFRLTSDWRLDLRSGEYYEVMVRRQIDRVRALFDKNFWNSIRSLASKNSTSPKFLATDQDFTDDYTKRIDGSVGYHLSFRGRTAQQVNSTIAASIKLPRYSVSQLYQNALEVFTRNLLDRGVRVIFFIPPHHPGVFRLRSGNAEGKAVLGWSEYVANLKQVEDYIHGALVKAGAEIVGAFDPEPFKVSDDEFYDWMHPKEVLIERLFESIGT